MARSAIVKDDGKGRTVKRRAVLATMALGTAAVLGLAACSPGGAPTPPGSTSAPAAAAGPVTLKFWSWVPGIEKAVDQWNSEHPDIKVDLNRIPASDSSKIPAAVDAGTGPDIAQFSQHALPDYVISKQALDITQYVGSTKDLYTPSSWKAVDFGGKIYGVPQDSGPGALLYRKDIFEKYGIDVPKTWADYTAAAKKLHDADPNVYIGQFSPNEPAGLYYPDMVQAGGSWFGTQDNSWTVQVNNDASKKVADRYQTLLDQKLLKVEQMWTPEYWADVNAGKIASINLAAWFPSVLESNAKGLEGKWAVAPSPSDQGDGTSGDGGGAVLAVMKTSKNPEAATKFITWLNSSKDGVKHLITEGGIFPSAKAGLESDALKKPNPYFGGQVINDVFVTAASKVPTTNVEGPGFQATNATLTDEFAKVATGDETFAQALDNTQSATVKRLQSQGLNVK